MNETLIDNFINNSSLFKLEKQNIFTNNVRHIRFPIRSIFLYKSYNLGPFCFLKKRYVTENRTYVNKVGNLLNPYLLTVLLSISFNKLPLKIQRILSTGSNRRKHSKRREISMMEPLNKTGCMK